MRATCSDPPSPASSRRCACLRVLRDEKVIEAARHEATAVVAVDPDLTGATRSGQGCPRPARRRSARPTSNAADRGLPRLWARRHVAPESGRYVRAGEGGVTCRRRRTRRHGRWARDEDHRGDGRWATARGSQGDLTRPTSDRVREAVFSGLGARGALQGARVMDLFAGSGALGLEAASRGAAQVVLVDSSRQATDVARRNVARLGMPAAVVLSSAQKYLAGRTPVSQDVVLIDPPYGIGEDVVAEVLAALVDGGWLAPGGLVVLERSSRGPEPRVAVRAGPRGGPPVWRDRDLDGGGAGERLLGSRRVR